MKARINQRIAAAVSLSTWHGNLDYVAMLIRRTMLRCSAGRDGHA